MMTMARQNEDKTIQIRTTEMAAPPAALIEASLKLPPRDMVAVRQNLTQMATSSPEMARSCIYVTPVGKDAKTGLQKFKLGESVRLAEIAQGAFGRFMVDVRIEEETPAQVTMKAMLMDLQTLNIYPGIGTATIHGGRRKLALGGATSIAKRNAIMAAVKPFTSVILPEIKAAIVKDLAESGKPLDALQKLTEEYEVIGVSKEQLKAATETEKTNADRVVLLSGILNAIRDGLISAEEAFGGGPEGTASKPDLSGATKKVEPATKAPEAPAAPAAPMPEQPGPTPEPPAPTAPEPTAPTPPPPAAPQEGPKQSTATPTIHAQAATVDLATAKFQQQVLAACEFIGIQPPALSAALLRVAGVAELIQIPADKRAAVMHELHRIADAAAGAEADSADDRGN
jgi:hypothetical protein